MSEATGTGPDQERPHSSPPRSGLRRAPWALAILAIAALGVVATGCGGDDDDEGDTTAAEETTTEATTTTEAGGGGGGGEAGGGGDAAAGEQIFADNCATCHGEDGSGGQGPNLQNAGLDEAAVVEQVTNGGGGMPPFGGQLSEQEIQDVAAYVVEDIGQG